MRTFAIINLMLLILNGAGVARDLSPEELEKWFESDELSPSPVSFEDVNEGNLVFLLNQPGKPVHHYNMQLIIDAKSLDTGWVTIKQCHTNIDNVARAQIMYKKDKVKDIRITHSENIDKSWVEENSVQLTNIGKGARLCVIARSQALKANKNNEFILINGPFMRRFLDGYYPMRVSLQVEFPTDVLQWQSISPSRQKGFNVFSKNGKVNVDAWFEGRLKTELRFKRISM